MDETAGAANADSRLLAAIARSRVMNETRRAKQSSCWCRVLSVTSTSWGKGAQQVCLIDNTEENV